MKKAALLSLALVAIYYIGANIMNVTRTIPPNRSPEIDTVARTIYGEARGEGPEGMNAVACVIMNRAQNPGWWGKGFEGVCQKALQFSCWNEFDPNFWTIQGDLEADPVFQDCLWFAGLAVGGSLVDVTNGATHYYAVSAKDPNWKPSWADKMTFLTQIGNHRFYK